MSRSTVGAMPALPEPATDPDAPEPQLAVSSTDTPTQTLLVTLSGDDRPGVTRTLFAALADFPLVVLDVEQLVVRGRLVLAVLVGIDPDAGIHDPGNVLMRVRTAMRHVAAAVDMDVVTVPGAGEAVTRRPDRLEVTVLGSPLRPQAVTRVAMEIADRGGNIDRIRRIAAYPVTAIAFEGSGADVGDLRRALARSATTLGVDIAVQEPGLDRRGQHLIVMDVDSTVIQDEVIDLLADEAQVGDEVARITAAAMSGQVDFEASLRQRVALLAGLPVARLEAVRQRITLTPGARTLCRTLRRLGYRVCLVSGGFIDVIAPIAQDLEVDGVLANRLAIRDGRLTGELLGPVVDRVGKRRALESFADQFQIPMRRTIAIGDGANDVDMLEAAGLGIAFNGKAPARDAADAALSVPYLDSVLFLLGITREEIERADAEDAGSSAPDRLPVTS